MANGEYISHSADETKKIAQEFAKTLHEGDVVCLFGDLGAGKTAFAQGLAKGLEIEQHVTSPTFTIVNEYSGNLKLYHFDVYRIADPEEMYEIGYDEYINGDGISVIEWPELIYEILPRERYNIKIEKSPDNDDYRVITIERSG